MPNSGDRNEQSKAAISLRRATLHAAMTVLREALGLRADVQWADGDADRSDVVVVEWRGQAGPARRLHLEPWTSADVDAVNGERTGAGPNDSVVWVLTRATVAQRGALRARGEQFVDLGGGAHLTLPWALVDRTDLTPVRPATTHLRSPADPFTDKSSLVLRTLFTADDPHRFWQVRELAAAAGVGVSTASEVLKTLAERQLVTITRHGRNAEVRLANPAAVLDAWTRAYDWRQNRHIVVQASIGDPGRFLRRLPDIMHPRFRWALTLQAGASLVAPHATWDRVHLYVDVPAPDRADWRHILALAVSRGGWPSGPDGRLVVMTPYYSHSAWYGMRTIRELPVVSDLQLALDLWHYPLRGREQAEHLVEHVLRRKASDRVGPEPPSPRARNA